MSSFFLVLERASYFGLAALFVALLAQIILDRRVPASWRVWVWRVALLQTGFALIAPVPLRLAVLPPRPSLAPSSHPMTAPQAPAWSVEKRELPVSSGASPSAPIAMSGISPIRAPFASVVAPRPNLAWLFCAAYALGLIVRFGILAACFARTRRLLGTCQGVEAVEVQGQLREISRKMQVSPLPRLLQSETKAPCLMGIFRPTIVLSPALLASQDSDLAAVLAHELAHLKRRDLVWNALLWPLQSLLWFHPLVWGAQWFLALETESACDEMVLGATRVAPQSYGALILNTMNNPTTPLAAGISDGFFALKKRLARLNQTPKRPRRAVQIAFASALCLSFGASIPLRLVARAQTQSQPAIKAQSPTNPYKVARRIPQNNTPEVEVGLPATLEEAFQRANTTIAGRVIYENGKPAAGIRIMTFCHWNAQTELWGYHRNQANHYRWPDKIDKLLSGVTTTRADGTYRFTGLLPQRYSIHLIGDNFGNRAPAGWMAPYRGEGVTTVANQTRRARDTVLHRSAQIRIRAVDQNSGAPLEGVIWLSFIVNESGEKITAETVDAHQGSRPSKGFDSQRVTDKNGYCTLDLEPGKAYFFMWGGNYMGSTASDKPAKQFKGLPDSFMTAQGRYKSAAWCQVKALAPVSEAKKPARRAWKGETEFQLERGPAASYVVKLKRIRALRPDEQKLLAIMKRRF